MEGGIIVLYLCVWHNLQNHLRHQFVDWLIWNGQWWKWFLSKGGKLVFLRIAIFWYSHIPIFWWFLYQNSQIFNITSIVKANLHSERKPNASLYNFYKHCCKLPQPPHRVAIIPPSPVCKLGGLEHNHWKWLNREISMNRGNTDSHICNRELHVLTYRIQ